MIHRSVENQFNPQWTFSQNEQEIAKKLADFKQIIALKSNSERYDRVVVTKQPMDELKKYCRVIIPARE